MRKNLYASLIAALSVVVGCHFWQSTNSIIAITSFHEVDFDAIQKDTLVIFDVDETLIHPSDAYMMNQNSKQSNIFHEKFFAEHPEVTDWHALNARIIQQAGRTLIEPEIITIVQQLQMRGIQVIACTNIIREAPFGNYASTLDWRYQHLTKLGFKGSFNDAIINLDQLERKPIFYKGILVTDLLDKGLIIGAFLEATHMHPKHIIMFDDRYNYLLSAQKECKKRGIAFTGYHYLGAFAVPWDEDLATFQLEYLIQHGIWLSDAQAQQAHSIESATAH